MEVKMPAKKKRGVSLVETMAVVSIFAVITFLVLETSLLAGNTFNKVQTTSFVIQGARSNFEKVANDLRLADRCLAYYPTRATPLYSASTNKTLILRIPVFDVNKKPIAGTFSVFIYRLVADAGPNGPNVLNLYTASITPTKETTPVFAKTIATQLTSITFASAAQDQFQGDPGTNIYTLQATPSASIGGLKNQVLIGGVDRIADGNATIQGQTVILKSSLNWGVPIDVEYPCDPSVAADSDGSNATDSVRMVWNISATYLDRLDQTQSQPLVIDSRFSLLNR
jgi:type II secretory pathway pseudopilin PulG